MSIILEAAFNVNGLHFASFFDISLLMIVSAQAYGVSSRKYSIILKLILLDSTFSLAGLFQKKSWLRTQFTTLSFRVYKNQQILNTVLYYQRPPASAARIDCHFAHLVPPLAAAQCNVLANYMFGLNAWVRLVAIDFMTLNLYSIKVYFETDRPELSVPIRCLFSNTENEKACNRILDYAEQSHLLFRGLAISVPSDKTDFRFNFYINQQKL